MKNVTIKLREGETNYKRPFWRGVSKRGLAILSYHLRSEGCWDLHLSRQSTPIATMGIFEELSTWKVCFCIHKVQWTSSSSSYPFIILTLPSHYGKDRENEESWVMYYWTRLTNDTSFLSISQWPEPNPTARESGKCGGAEGYLVISVKNIAKLIYQLSSSHA